MAGGEATLGVVKRQNHPFYNCLPKRYHYYISRYQSLCITACEKDIIVSELLFV